MLYDRRLSVLRNYTVFLILTPLFFVGFSTIISPSIWFKILPMASEVRYLDLSLLTYNVDCFTMGQTDLSSLNCDPGGRDFNYPLPLLQMFKLLNLGADSTLVVGFLFLIVVIATFGLIHYMFIKNNSTIYESVILSLSFVSPPVLLLLERANVDILLFALLVFVIFFARFRIVILLAGIVGFGLKVYLIGLAVFGLRRKDTIYFLIMLFSCSVWLLITYRDFIRVFQYSDYYEWGSFGIRALPIQVFNYLQVSFSGKGLFLISNAVGLILFASILWVVSRFMNSREHFPLFDLSTENATTRFCLAAGVWITIYFIGLNFDMRIIFAFPLFFMLTSRVRFFSLLPFVFVLFSAFYLPWLQSIGDSFILFFTVLVFYQLLRIMRSNFLAVSTRVFPSPNRRMV